MQLKDVPIGSKVMAEGVNYYNAPITFEVIGQNHYGNNTTTLLTERIISIKAFSSKEPRNTNSDRRSYGNNNWEVSNIRQWLNSDGTSWYSSTHQYSEPPTAGNLWEGRNPYNTEKGFLANFPADFVQAIVPLETQYAKASVDGGGLGKTTDKVRLLSRAEVGLGAEGFVTDGKAFPKFTDNSSRIAKPTTEAVSNSGYKNSSLNANAGWHYWLRTAYVGSSRSVRVVYSDGTIDINSAYYGGLGFRPALDLSQNLPVELINGIYYVKVKSTPNLKININGQTKQASDMYININGVARPITKMYVNVNGVAKEVK